MRSQDLQVGGEHAVGAEQPLDAHRRRDVRKPKQRVDVDDREDQLTEHPVGAVDEGQAFLLRKLDGRESRACQRGRRGSRHTVGRAELALPGRGQRDVCERSEVARAAEAAEFEHLGVSPAVSIPAYTCATSGRMPVRPVASVDSRSSIIARTTSVSTSAPDPAACERIRLRCSWVRRSGGMCRVANAPNPVDTP